MRQITGDVEGWHDRRRKSVQRDAQKWSKQGPECSDPLGFNGSDFGGSGRTDKEHLGDNERRWHGKSLVNCSNFHCNYEAPETLRDLKMAPCCDYSSRKSMRKNWKRRKQNSNRSRRNE